MRAFLVLLALLLCALAGGAAAGWRRKSAGRRRTPRAAPDAVLGKIPGAVFGAGPKRRGGVARRRSPRRPDNMKDARAIYIP